MQIGGKNFLEKRTALSILATKCDGLLFIGKLSFQIMHALGMSVPMNLIEDDAVDEAFDLIQLAKKRGIDIIFPDDFRCVNDQYPEAMDVFSSNGIQPGTLASSLFCPLFDCLLPLTCRFAWKNNDMFLFCINMVQFYLVLIGKKWSVPFGPCSGSIHVRTRGRVICRIWCNTGCLRIISPLSSFILPRTDDLSLVLCFWLSPCFLSSYKHMSDSQSWFTG